MSDLARVPLQASVGKVGNTVELAIAFESGPTLRFLVVHRALGLDDAVAAAENIARRLNRDGVWLDPKTRDTVRA